MTPEQLFAKTRNPDPPPNFLVWLEAQNGLNTYLDLASDPTTEHLAFPYVNALLKDYERRIGILAEINREIQQWKKVMPE